MKKETLLVESAGHGGRLDRYLAAHYPSWSRTRLQRLIETGSVLVDGAAASSNEKLKSGQTIVLSWPEPKKISVVKAPSKIKLSILFEDRDLIVVDKPAGLVVHPAVGHHDGNTLVEILEPKMADGAWR
jgi:23S rRNA pseudouridine1911/1915/1917 synthase